MKKLRVGVVGCGNISGIYLKNCRTMFENLDVVAVADLLPERAAAKAAEFGVARACSPEELFVSPEVDAVLDLSLPLAHAGVRRAALEAGKQVYGEKPLATELGEAEALVELARSSGLRLGCAPDTFLGAGLQTCRRLIDEGRIGEVVGATAFMLCGGHEGWHPDPAFYYKRGGGPMLDMGPYYLHALVSLMGPIAAVRGFDRITWPERIVASAPRFGERIAVEVPTSVLGILEFESGASAMIMTSFDAPGGTSHAPLEVYGSEGTLVAPDPNTFGGAPRLRRKGESEFADQSLLFGHAENSRGIGLSDMAAALEEGRPARASGELALHALEAMVGLHRSAETGERYVMRHRCARPEALKPGGKVA
jgi:predicted dehydrogenase